MIQENENTEKVEENNSREMNKELLRIRKCQSCIAIDEKKYIYENCTKK